MSITDYMTIFREKVSRGIQHKNLIKFNSI